jgi:hypothetical protein
MEAVMNDVEDGKAPESAGCLKPAVGVGLGLALGLLAGIVVGLVAGVGIAMILGVL